MILEHLVILESKESKKKKKARKLLRMGKKDLGAKSQMSKLKTVRD